jgi:uncharacterized tellurite resistance protein B-like protein
MGLFDVFKSEPIKLNPYLSLAVGLLYMMASDGQIEEEEVGQLRTVFGEDDAVIQTALKYLKSSSLDQFLTESAAVMNEQQKLCVLINMADSLLSDGRAEPNEQALFNRAMTAYGMTEATFGPYFQTIMIKNNRSVFRT